jgi:RimJ/RimL family protein N-acetyltransferase
MTNQVLQTERLILRRFTADDAEEYFPLVSDPEILRYAGGLPVKSIDETRQMLLKLPIRDYELHGYGRMACIEKSSGRLIGFSGIKYLPGLQETDVGYRFLKDCWGKGYATEGARPLMREGIREHGLKRIIGLAESANAASTHVLEKLGLVFERTIMLDDHPNELELYGIDTRNFT